MFAPAFIFYFSLLTLLSIMLILAIDTSGKNGGITLYRHHPRLLHNVTLEGGTYSAQLVPQLEALLKENQLSARDLEGLAVVNGPGSFTGLRVGLGAVKGLAEALAIPVATVSALEIVASSGGQGGGRILSALDAGRREAYVGDYEYSADANDQQLHCRREELLTWEALASHPEAMMVHILTPDAPLAEFLASRGLPVSQIARPGSERAALLGYPKLKLGRTTPVETLDANYLRRSDAELYSLPKLQS